MTATTSRRITWGLVGALSREWAALLVTTPPVHRWAAAEPALADAVTLADVGRLAAEQHGNDEVLAALLRLAQSGDELAARTLLQVMLGAVVRLAARTVHHADGDLEESRARAVAALWAAIRAYPLDRRRRNHADRLSLDVLSALTRDRRRATQRAADGSKLVVREYAMGVGCEQLTGESGPASPDTTAARLRHGPAPSSHGSLAGDDAHPMCAAPGDSPDSPRRSFWAAAAGEEVARACSDEQLILLLAWGARRGVVSPDDARLLLLLHSPADPSQSRNARQLAEEVGLSHAALRQRVSRATRHLAAAVRTTARLPLERAPQAGQTTAA